MLPLLKIYTGTPLGLGLVTKVGWRELGQLLPPSTSICTSNLILIWT